ncbi:MAG: thymidine phosphorylase [Gammaproteobacteria bacterium]
MLAQEVIRALRDREALSDKQIESFVGGITDGSISDAQIAAFTMAACINGLSFDESVALTRAMADSGDRFDWREQNLDGPVVDKHSTGGVGDKLSLMLAPMLAACGAFVPMISGRGLGHTGGTLDKLEAIPGYEVAPSRERFRHAVQTAGCAIVGASADIAPADRRMYAVRDVTATVESVGLITASILSKKLAAGVDALVMDVKTGSGAFASCLEEARALAQMLCDVASGAGLPAISLITDMNQPLGTTAGNALEVREAVEFLRASTDSDHSSGPDARVTEAVMALGSQMLVLSGLEADPNCARVRLLDVLRSGGALDRFDRMVGSLGGPHEFSARANQLLPAAAVIIDVFPERAGIIESMDTRSLGLVVVELGGGRRRAEDALDPAVGLDHIRGIGESVGPDAPLARVHARTGEQAEAAAERIRACVCVTANSSTAPTRPAVVIETIGARTGVARPG